MFSHDGLSQLWNELVRDGEITNGSTNGLMNSAGVLSMKGKLFFYIDWLFGVKAAFNIFSSPVQEVLNNCLVNTLQVFMKVYQNIQLHSILDKFETYEVKN